MVKAILLAGGYATRLQPLSLRLPKVLLPVAGKPVIAYALELLREAGVTDLIVSLNEQQKVIQETLGDGSAYGVKIDYVFEASSNNEDKLGAIGAILNSVQKAGVCWDSLVLGTDNFVQGLDLKAFRNQHESSKAGASIALFQLSNKSDVEHFGVAKLEGKRITAFQEKPRVEEAVSTLASTAVYYLSKHALCDLLPEYVAGQKAAGERADRLGDFWKWLLDKTRVEGFVFQGVWGDIGTPATYLDTNRLAMNSLVKGELVNAPGTFSQGDVVCGKGVVIERGAVIKGPAILEDGCVIGANSVIGPYAHLEKKARVGSDCVIRDSILFEDSSVGDSCHLTGSLIDKGATVGGNSRLDYNSIIGEECVLGERSRVLADSRIWPRLRLSKESVLEGAVSST